MFNFAPLVVTALKLGSLSRAYLYKFKFHYSLLRKEMSNKVSIVQIYLNYSTPRNSILKPESYVLFALLFNVDFIQVSQC